MRPMLSIDDVCRSRCAAVRDRFGVWKIDFREIWNSATCPERPATVLVEGGLRRRPVPALGVSSRTVRRPRAAGLFFARCEAAAVHAGHPGPMATGPDTIEGDCR